MTQIPIPNKDLYEAKMIEGGDKWGAAFTNGLLPTDDNKLANNYYDGTWIYQQIYDYRKARGFTEQKWLDYSYQGKLNYQDWYLHTFTSPSGYRTFPHGIYQRWIRYGLAADKIDLINISQDAAYARDTTPLSATQFANPIGTQDAGSREAAYALECYILAEKVGEAIRPKRNGYVDQCLDHLNQWTVTRNVEYVRPFMVAITSQALIEFYEHAPNDSRLPTIISMLRTAWAWVWANCWLPADGSFMYTDRDVPTGGTYPTNDLNLLIAPPFAWLYHRTGETQWRDWGDQVFSNGPAGIYLGGGDGKQYNQSMRWSMRYIEWRELDPLVDPPPFDPPPVDPPPDPIPTHTPGGTSQLYTVKVPSITLPVAPTSFAQKFTQNGWANIQAQYDAGYHFWLQPGALTGQFIEVIDIKVLVTDPTLVALTYNPIVIDGAVTITPKLSFSTDNSSWTDYPGVSQALVFNFRYVKITLDAVATNKKGVVQIDEIRLRLSLKEKRDGGAGNVTNAATGAVVTFNKTFLDVESIEVTPNFLTGSGAGNTSVAIYDFTDIANPTSFTVYLYDSSGVKTTGLFSWSAKGV